MLGFGGTAINADASSIGQIHSGSSQIEVNSGSLNYNIGGSVSNNLVTGAINMGQTSLVQGSSTIAGGSLKIVEPSAKTEIPVVQLSSVAETIKVVEKPVKVEYPTLNQMMSQNNPQEEVRVERQSKKVTISELRQEAQNLQVVPPKHAITKFEVSSPSPIIVSQPKKHEDIILKPEDGKVMSAAEIRAQSGIKIGAVSKVLSPITPQKDKDLR